MSEMQIIAQVPTSKFGVLQYQGTEFVSKPDLLRIIRECKEANEVEAGKMFCGILYTMFAEATT